MSKLVPLRIPTGWTVRHNTFLEEDTDRGEDLLWLEHQDTGVVLDVIAELNASIKNQETRRAWLPPRHPRCQGDRLMHICFDELYAFVLLIPHAELIMLRARGFWRRLRGHRI